VQKEREKKDVEDKITHQQFGTLSDRRPASHKEPPLAGVTDWTHHLSGQSL